LDNLPDCFAVVGNAVAKKGEQVAEVWSIDKTFSETFGSKHWGGFGEYCKQVSQLKCDVYKAWVGGVQRTTIPFQGYYNLYTPGLNQAVVADIIDFRGYKPLSTIGPINHTDDGINLIVNINMKPSFFISQYNLFEGNWSLLPKYITSSNGVDVPRLPYISSLPPESTNYTVTIPLANITRNEDGSIVLIQFDYFCVPTYY